MVKIKTSIAIKTSILLKIDEYRATLRPIPTKTEAIEKLILLGLELQQNKLSSRYGENIKPEFKTENKNNYLKNSQTETKKEAEAGTAKKTIDYANKLKDALSKPL